MPWCQAEFFAIGRNSCLYMEHHSLLHKKEREKKSLQNKCQSWIDLSSWSAHIQYYNPVPPLAENYHFTPQKKTHPKQHVETQRTSSKYNTFEKGYQGVLTLEDLKVKTFKDSDSWKINPVKLMCSVTQGTKHTARSLFLNTDKLQTFLICKDLTRFNLLYLRQSQSYRRKLYLSHSQEFGGIPGLSLAHSTEHSPAIVLVSGN